jgi:hypothetical protein
MLIVSQYAAPKPRLALSCAFSSADFEPPYIKQGGGDAAGAGVGAGGAGLNLKMRLALAGGQVVNYGDRWIEQVAARVVDLSY